MTIENTELTRQFPMLDSLRAVGSFAVLLTHVGFWSGAYTDYAIAGPLLSRMDVGVAIFFVLSGFLLSRQWLVRAEHGLPAPRLGRYLLKRVLRIWPVYVVAAVLALVFVEANDDLGVVDWVVTLTLLDIYVDPALPHGLTQMWSLATEVAFYLVLPLLMLLVVPRGRPAVPVRTAALLVVMVVLSVAWLTSLSEQVPGAEDRMVGQWLPAYLAWFAMGIGLAHLQVRYAADRLPARVREAVTVLASSPGTLWVVAAAALVVASTPIAGPTLLTSPTVSEAVTKNLLYAVIGGLLVFAGAFATEGSRYGRAMSASWARHLGHISYGVFCIHLPVLHLVMWLTGYELFRGHLGQILVLTVVLSVAAAELLYRLVERPFMRLATVNRGRSATKADPTSEVSTR